jgi:hypothetical protein
MKRLFAVLWLAAIGFNSGALALSVSSPACKKAFDYLESRGEVYFRFEIGSRAEIVSLTNIISIDNVMGNVVYAYANKTEFKRFLEKKIPFDVLLPPGLEPVEIKMSDYAELTQTKNSAMAKTAAVLAWDAYPTYDGYVTMMNTFASTYPALCKVEDIGTSIQGRRIMSVKISDNVAQNEKEPKFFYQSSIHGDEVCGYVLMLRLIDYLLVNYQTDARVKRLVDNLEIWINPLANPDGTYRGGNSSVSGAVRYNSNNVDLNRSFPSPAGASEAQQQPETVVFMNFSRSHHFTLSADFHGGAEVACYVWGCWSRNHADRNWWLYVCKEWADTAQANGPAGYFAGTTSTGYINGYQWYVVNGERMNWEGYWQQCRDLTIELSVTKLLAASQLPNHWNYQYKSFLNYLEQAFYGVRGTVTDSITGAPLAARVWANHDVDSSHVFAHLPWGDYYRLLNAGTYTLTFMAVDSATGRLDTATYYPKTISNVVVVNKQATVLDVKLVRKTTGTRGTIKTMVNAAPLSIIPVLHGIKIVMRDAGARGSTTIAIYGVNGKLVRELPVTSAVTLWDGKNREGNSVPTGCYIVKAVVDNVTCTRDFVLPR